MNDELITAFDECLQALASGASLAESLAHHRDQADDLRPMLQAAQAARALGDAIATPRQAQSASRAQFLARAAELHPARANAGLRAPARGAARPGLLGRWSFAARSLTIGLAFVLGFVLGTYGVVMASAQSLPGDPFFYGLKRIIEHAELALAPNAQARGQLEEAFALRRVEEARSVTAQHRTVPIDFSGRLEGMDGERWSVAAVVVIVPLQAEIIGTPFLGAVVQVRGVSQAEGTVLAWRIEVNPAGPAVTPPAASPEPTEAGAVEIEFVGVVESIGAEAWQIGGLSVRVTSATEIRGNPQVGQSVEVKAIREAGGALTAVRIRAESSSDGPSASRTPEADDDDQTPEPSRTPDSGGGSGPSATNTPRPDEEDKTPEPTEAHEADDGGGPSASNTPELERVEFEGTLQSVSQGIWVVSDRAVLITLSTEIDGNPQVGDEVEVRALRRLDGSLVATKIEKK